jgi:hypothetical protein
MEKDCKMERPSSLQSPERRKRVNAPDHANICTALERMYIFPEDAYGTPEAQRSRQKTKHDPLLEKTPKTRLDPLRSPLRCGSVKDPLRSPLRCGSVKVGSFVAALSKNGGWSERKSFLYILE